MEILKEFKKENMSLPKKIILTHADADGLTASMVIQTAIEKLFRNEFNLLVISSISPTISETEKMISYVMKNYILNEKDEIYISDRAMPSVDFLEKKKIELGNATFISIDHHMTNHPNLWKISSYKNIDYIWDEKESGATLALKWFERKRNLKELYPELYSNLETFSEKVKLWDTFAWTKLDLDKEEDKKKYIGAFSINATEKIYGNKFFYKKIIEYREELYKLDSILEIAYEAYLEKYNDFSKHAILNSNEYSYGGLTIKTFYNIKPEYQALFTYNLLNNSEADILVFLNPYGTISLRSKENIDISKMAQDLGEIAGYSGGGHRNASAYKTMDGEKLKNIIENCFIENMKKLAIKNKKSFREN